MTTSSDGLYEKLQAAAEVVRARAGGRVPEVALVLGSGLGAFADTFADSVAIPYDEIPGMHASTVKGHAGQLVIGKVGAVTAVAMQGRIHLYEGHDPHEVVFGARLMRTLGAEQVIITNAAGGTADSLEPGDLMLITDQLNLTGTNSLLGANDERIGPRFPDMSTAFDAELGERASEVAKGLGFELARGVYAGLLGPTYETPAEVRMLRTLGADAVGMSTVLEVIAARHMGARVLGISCITNKAAGLGHETLDHKEVQEVAERVRERFIALLRGLLAG